MQQEVVEIEYDGNRNMMVMADKGDRKSDRQEGKVQEMGIEKRDRKKR